MDEEYKKFLVADIAGELQDSAYGIGTEADRERTAVLVADRIERSLHQMSWRPPETYSRVVHWAAQTGNLPEHHVNRSVLNSQLAELTQILHDHESPARWIQPRWPTSGA